MGLFGKLFKKAPESTAPEVEVVNTTPGPKYDIEKDWYYQDVNLTEKNVKVEVDEDEKLIKGTCYLQSAHGNIQMYETANLIFEVTKRSKAYKELEPFVGQNVWYVVLTKKNGDYGLYYRAMIKHKLSKAEAQELMDKHKEA